MSCKYVLLLTLPKRECIKPFTLQRQRRKGTDYILDTLPTGYAHYASTGSSVSSPLWLTQVSNFTWLWCEGVECLKGKATLRLLNIVHLFKFDHNIYVDALAFKFTILKKWPKQKAREQHMMCIICLAMTTRLALKKRFVRYIPCNDDCFIIIVIVPWQQGPWGQHEAHLGPAGPRWAPCWPHEPCYLGRFLDHTGAVSLKAVQHAGCLMWIRN